jgi:Mn2+/Fe2+ NRAMP family transporter
MALNSSRFGPGALVTAAFIGPGTVTVCTLAGVDHGFSLLWAILFAVLICYLLQEMAARFGIVTRKGLGEALRGELHGSLVRLVAISIVLGAIVVGNAAYEAGNISGGALGLQEITGVGALQFGSYSISPVNILIALLASMLLYTGSYRFIERTLVVLVLLMSIAFALVAIATRPAAADLLMGLVPSMSTAQTLTVIGLIGTTVVPYNLFLHASIVQEKWSGAAQIPVMRHDTALTVGAGGFVSMAIIISAAAMQGRQIADAAQLAQSLEPVFGVYARHILAIGLFSAGITSAITAPLAAAYVASGCLGWNVDLRSGRMRLIWLTVVLAGLVFSMFGGSPIEIIRFAQVANGILLPAIVAFLLWAVNRKRLIGRYGNTPTQNLLGVAVLLVAVVLSLRSLWLVVQSMM